MADENNEEQVERVRPFADWLQDQRSGSAAIEASEALHELVEAVRDQGKPGELTIKVSVRPTGRDAATVLVTDEIKLKKPQADRGVSMYFVTDDNNLTREDPRQQRLPLREVAKDAKELREVKA